MSGIKYFLDTNAIISLLKGNLLLQKQIEQADWIGMSIISVIEYLTFDSLSLNDENLFHTFLSRVHVIDLSKNDLSLPKEIAKFKSVNKLKLPDAIIAASAISVGAVLVTNDKHFKTSMLPVKPY